MAEESAGDPRPAVILLSGGLDSATCLAVAISQGFKPVHTLAFDYGQRHRQELSAAKILSQSLGADEHRVVTIDLRQFGGSALTADIPVPKGRDESQMNAEIPITYVPARNTIFLSFALAFAEVRQARDIFIGVNAIDYSGYPDCRPQFIRAFEKMANLATKMSVSDGVGKNALTLQIHAPLIQLTKAQIITWGTELEVNYALTHSCYDPNAEGNACGKCDSCVLRKKGFAEAGITDPTQYIVSSD